MAQKVIDGVVYEVKEVDVSDLKQEVEKVIADVDADKKEKAVAEASIKNTECQFEGQILNYQKQIDGLQALIDTVKEKKEASIAHQKALIEELDAKIAELKAALADKKEVIETLLPEESKKLGLQKMAPVFYVKF